MKKTGKRKNQSFWVINSKKISGGLREGMIEMHNIYTANVTGCHYWAMIWPSVRNSIFKLDEMICNMQVYFLHLPPLLLPSSMGLGGECNFFQKLMSKMNFQHLLYPDLIPQKWYATCNSNCHWHQPPPWGQKRSPRGVKQKNLKKKKITGSSTTKS